MALVSGITGIANTGIKTAEKTGEIKGITQQAKDLSQKAGISFEEAKSIVTNQYYALRGSNRNFRRSL